MNKQLIILVSVLLACILYSTHSPSTLLCASCGCGHKSECHCGPCHYDTQSNSHNGRYGLIGCLSGRDCGNRCDRYGSCGKWRSKERGGGCTDRWGKSKSKSSCYSD